MDKKDRILLSELAKNSRQPLKQLAIKAGLSSPSAIYRINRLKEEGTILNFHTIVDSSRLGFLGYRAYFKFVNTTTEQENEVLDWLCEQRYLSVIGKTSGSIDVAIITWVKDPLQFNQAMKELKSKFRSRIAELTICSYLQNHYFGRRYLNDSSEDFCISQKFNLSSDYDELDFKLITLMLDNARISAVDLASQLHVTTKTVISRIRSLEERQIILGYGLNLDLTKLSKISYKLCLTFSNNVSYSSLFEFAKQDLRTVYVDETIEKYDFELNMDLSDENELNELINTLKDKFGGISSVEIFKIEKYLKLMFVSV